ncbi:MAG: hypothetical protein ABUK01_10435 [Leptospirales bacterium]
MSMTNIINDIKMITRRFEVDNGLGFLSGNAKSFIQMLLREDARKEQSKLKIAVNPIIIKPLDK